MVEKVKKIVFSRETIVFLLFLLLSTVLWFIQSLDQKRISTISVPIRYVGTPSEIRLAEGKPTTIRIKLQDKGTNLIQYRARLSNPISVDMNREYQEKGEIIIPSKQFRTIFSQRLQSTTSILDITPDTVKIKYEKLTNKKLPVKLISDVKLPSQYMFSHSVKIQPDSVKAYGTKSALKDLTEILTRKIHLKSLKDTTLIEVELEKEPKNINFEKKKVLVTFFVERFTERKEQIPLTIINNNENENIKLFPSSVQVSYNIGLPHYKKVSKDDIQIVFDVKKAKKSANKKYRPQIIVNSQYIKDININPTEIEFLTIEKQKQ